MLSSMNPCRLRKISCPGGTYSYTGKKGEDVKKLNHPICQSALETLQDSGRDMEIGSENERKIPNFV